MTSKKFGLLAEFADVKTFFHACEKIRDEKYTYWDSHSPFPVHGIDKAMGLKASKLPWITLVMCIAGGTLGMTMQWWMSAVDYKIIVSGKPLFSWQAFIPVTFELTILLGALGTVFGMLHLNKLPMFYHAVFNSKRFEKVTDDKFFISIEARDPKYNEESARALFQQLHAVNIETVDE